jgi:extradiol dioxygenase family protein
VRNPSNVFHLAIRCRDLDEAVTFYVDKLGCRLARRYEDRITMEFFGDQLVCHLSPDKIDQAPEMYPRHFGITFPDRAEFNALYERAHSSGAEFFREMFVRFEGEREEHLTFFLRDPSNNLLEFKYYRDPEMKY